MHQESPTPHPASLPNQFLENASLYIAKPMRDISYGKGYGHGELIAVFRHSEEKTEQIGSYERNYSALFKTFCPFRLKGQDLALYSRDYTATRIMSLPDCQDLGGEDPSGGGFCPVEYHLIPGTYHGFVAGCIWGDDSSWKIQYLNLSRAEEGILRREEKFGYIRLPHDVSLCNAVRYTTWEDKESVHFVLERQFDLKTGKEVDPFE